MPEGRALGSGDWTDEDAYQYLKEAIDGHPDLPFFIIAQAGGPQDGAGVSMGRQVSYFADQKYTFSYGMDPGKNNFYFTCSDFTHDQIYMPYYIYTARNILFQ